MKHHFQLIPSLLIIALMGGASANAADATSLLLAPPSQPAAQQPVLAPQPSTQTAPTTAVTTTKAPSQGPSSVELAALYFYARSKAEDRVQAEFARLKQKYPSFELPRDLYHAEAKPVDEAPLWALYEKDDFAGVDAEIARLKAARPDWAPSSAFTDSYNRKKLRVAMTSAAKAKNWPAVAMAGAAINPETEKDVDLIWDLIDAQSALGQKDQLARSYQAILFRPPALAFPKDVIVSTIKKATRDFSPADVQGVMAQFSTDPVIMAGLASVSTDLIRKAVADFNVDPAQTAPLGKDKIDALTAAASEGKSTSDFSLLGWYFLKIKQPADASAWFRRAIDTEPDVDHAKGLYLSLVEQQRDDEAYDVAVQYRDALADDPVFLMNALAARISGPHAVEVKPEAVAAYAKAIVAAKSGPNAEILAWYAYNSGQFQAARAWFDKAFAWEPNDVRLKGLALSLGQLGDKPALVALYKQYQQKYPAIWDDVHLARGGAKKRNAQRIDRIQVGAVEPQQKQPSFLEPEKPTVEPAPRHRAPARSDGGFAAYLGAKRYSACIAAIQMREAQGALPADAQLIKGWCMLGLNRNAEARDAFTAGLSGAGKTRSDAAYGLALTLLRGKMTDEARSVIALYPLSPARDKEIKLSIYWQMARDAFDREDYQQTLDALNARIALAPEPADMTQLRGWAHLKLGHRAEARAIFAQISDYIDDSGARRGLAATRETQLGSR